MKDLKINDNSLLSEKEMQLVYGFCAKTLQNHRCQRTGMPYIKIGRMVRYRKKDVDQYLQQHMVKYNYEA